MKQQTCLMQITALLLALGVFLGSCSSTTIIQSNPSGARVYMNEEFKGTTPYTYSDTKIVGSVTYVRLELEGYETLQTILSRNESVDVGAIIGGLFVWIPFLWTMKYNPVHNYELKPLKSASLAKDLQPTLLKDTQGNEYVSCVLNN